MAVLCMVPRENLTYIGSHALWICMGAFRTSPASSLCSSQRTSTLHTAKNVEHTVFPQTRHIPEQSGLQHCLQPKFKASFSLKPNQIPTLGIRIAPELEKICFNQNTVSRLCVPVTPPWLLRCPGIDLTLYILQIKPSLLQRFLRSDFTNCVIALKISIIWF